MDLFLIINFTWTTICYMSCSSFVERELRRGYRSSFFNGLATAHTLADPGCVCGGGGGGGGGGDLVFFPRVYFFF